jgi:predicted AlkP superfamily pyrophosphatase or phosphodiesterase
MRTIPRRAGAVLAWALCLATAGCAGNFGPAQPRPGALARHVVVISIDGLRPDAIQAAGASNLLRMMQEGAYSLQARTIMPSRTLPSHTSMITGVQPAVHGITWNDEQVDAQGRVRVATMFDMADSAHLHTAAFFGKAKFRHLIHSDAPDEVEAPRGLEVVLAPRITQDVIQYLQFNRPDLLFVHIPDPDIAGHSAGWMTLPYRWAVRRADAAVEQIRDGRADPVDRVGLRRASGPHRRAHRHLRHGGHGAVDPGRPRPRAVGRPPRRRRLSALRRRRRCIRRRRGSRSPRRDAVDAVDSVAAVLRQLPARSG